MWNHASGYPWVGMACTRLGPRPDWLAPVSDPSSLSQSFLVHVCLLLRREPFCSQVEAFPLRNVVVWGGSAQGSLSHDHHLLLVVMEIFSDELHSTSFPSDCWLQEWNCCVCYTFTFTSKFHTSTILISAPETGIAGPNIQAWFLHSEGSLA